MPATGAAAWSLKSSSFSWASYWTAHSFYDIAKRVFGESSIVAHIPCNDTSGTTLTDVKNGYNVPVVNAVLNQESFKTTEKSVYLDATAFGNIYAAASHLNTEEGSIIMWVKSTVAKWSVVADRFLIHLWGPTEDIQYDIRLAVNSPVYFRCYDGPTQVNNYAVAQHRKDGWHLLSMSWSKVNNEIKAFVNGVPVNFTPSSTMLNPVPVNSFRADLCGLNSRRGISAEDTFDAFYSNIIFLNRPHTEEELQRLYIDWDQIFFDGDSRTAAKGWDDIACNSNMVSDRNVAVSGYNLDQMIAHAPAEIDAKLRSGQKNTIVLWGGVNGGSGTGDNSAALYDKIRTYCLARKAAALAKGIDLKIVVCTEIDAQHVGSGDWHLVTYPNLNTLIRNDFSFADAVADLGNETELQDATNLTYYLADKLHLQTAGYTVVGGVVKTALQSIGSVV